MRWWREVKESSLLPTSDGLCGLTCGGGPARRRRGAWDTAGGLSGRGPQSTLVTGSEGQVEGEAVEGRDGCRLLPLTPPPGISLRQTRWARDLRVGHDGEFARLP